jgi:uncharacterized protein (DUF302 family)
MLLTIDTTKSLDQLRDDLPKACAAHRFGVLGVIDLRAKMKEKGVELGHPCVVFEVCNPQHAKRAIDAEAGISTMLPCRISVGEGPEGSLRLATMAPTKMVSMFGATGDLVLVAKEVEQALDAILHDAAR